MPIKRITEKEVADVLTRAIRQIEFHQVAPWASEEEAEGVSDVEDRPVELLHDRGNGCLILRRQDEVHPYQDSHGVINLLKMNMPQDPLQLAQACSDALWALAIELLKAEHYVGATFAGALVTESHIVSVGMGDSSVMLLRRFPDGQISCVPCLPLHALKYAEEAEKAALRGSQVFDDHETVRYLNSQLAPSRALGDLSAFRTDYMLPEPDVAVQSLRELEGSENYLLITTDGLLDVTHSRDLSTYLGEVSRAALAKEEKFGAAEIQDALRKLVLDRDTLDDTTCILVSISPDHVKTRGRLYFVLDGHGHDQAEILTLLGDVHEKLPALMRASIALSSEPFAMIHDHFLRVIEEMTDWLEARKQEGLFPTLFLQYRTDLEKFIFQLFSFLFEMQDIYSKDLEEDDRVGELQKSIDAFCLKHCVLETVIPPPINLAPSVSAHKKQYPARAKSSGCCFPFFNCGTKVVADREEVVVEDLRETQPLLSERGVRYDVQSCASIFDFAPELRACVQGLFETINGALIVSYQIRQALL